MITNAGKKKLKPNESKSTTTEKIDNVNIRQKPSVPYSTCRRRSIKWLVAIIILLLVARYFGGFASIVQKWNLK